MTTATSNQSAVSSASPAFQPRMRPDANILRQSYQGRDYWVIKDPISLKYYRFEEEEYGLPKMFNGRNSAEHIKRMFDFELRHNESRFRNCTNSQVCCTAAVC